MSVKKKILSISGSTRAGSVNLHILQAIAGMYRETFDCMIYHDIDQLPHFNPDLDMEPFPASVEKFRNLIRDADAVIICTPEYVFSLPGSLKNAIEWTVSTTVFTDKPAVLITASSSGQKAHEALNLVMQTVGVKLPPNGSLLIQAPKTKLTQAGEITDTATLYAIRLAMDSLIEMLLKH